MKGKECIEHGSSINLSPPAWCHHNWTTNGVQVNAKVTVWHLFSKGDPSSSGHEPSNGSWNIWCFFPPQSCPLIHGVWYESTLVLNSTLSSLRTDTLPQGHWVMTQLFFYTGHKTSTWPQSKYGYGVRQTTNTNQRNRGPRTRFYSGLLM